VKGELRRGGEVLDRCHGTWLTHLDWEEGVAAAGAGGKEQARRHRIWDLKHSRLRCGAAGRQAGRQAGSLRAPAGAAAAGASAAARRALLAAWAAPPAGCQLWRQGQALLPLLQAPGPAAAAAAAAAAPAAAAAAAARALLSPARCVPRRRHPVALEAEMLPSDCRHRQDLAYLQRGDMDAAQKWKQVVGWLGCAWGRWGHVRA
jgi:hypothetical protein